MTKYPAALAESGKPSGPTLRSQKSKICIIPGMSGMGKKDLTADILQKHLDRPFDQYQSYRMVAEVINRLREDHRPLRILDASEGEHILPDFLPEDQIAVLDGWTADEDAAAPLYEDQAFDYTVSVDAYARIEPGAREEFLSELRRVSQKGVLLLAPFDSDVVRAAEQVVNEFHRAVHLAEDARSPEHVINVLPTLEDTRRFFEKHEDTVSVLPNGYVPHWLAMTCLFSFGSKLEGALEGDLAGLPGRLNAFYNESIYMLDNAEPSYRHLLVSLREPADVDLAELVSPDSHPEHAASGTPLFGAISLVLPLTTEVRQLNTRLAEHERRLARKEGELARKEAQVNDLTRRLAEQVMATHKLVEMKQRALQRAHDAAQGAQQRALGEKERAQELNQELRNLNQTHNNLKRHSAGLKREKDDLQQQLATIANSRGWRLLNLFTKLRLRISRSG